MDATLAWIVGACLAGGVVSVLLAATLAYSLLGRWVPRMVSYAVGVLLGVTFLELLPEAFEASGDPHTLFFVVLGGILAFFLLEKAALWRHSHGEHGVDEGDAHVHKTTGLMVQAGDAFHNFVDGLLIAAAFLVDYRVGVTTALAIMTHEVPQEIGDFMVLLHAGYTRRRALLWNMIVSLASVAGGVVGYLLLDAAQDLLPYALALAASCFIYLAIADLIPHLHKQNHRGEVAWQVGLIAVGLGTTAVVVSSLH